MGINANFGYRLTPALSVQVAVDDIPKNEGTYKPDNAVKEEVDVLTGILSLKGYFPTSKPVKPFIIAGFGVCIIVLILTTKEELWGIT